MGQINHKAPKRREATVIPPDDLVYHKYLVKKYLVR